LIKSKMKYKFGEKLRTVRERRKLTLKDVAGKAGVSESLISQIERNKVSPSIDTLLLIADVLDIDHEYLFSNYRQKRKVAIVRSSDRDSISRNKMTIQQLSVAGDSTGENGIEAFLIQIETGGEKGDREYGHSGWEFGVILKGQAQLIYGNETYDLDEGDSISFPSDIPHLFKNIGEDTLEAIWVVAPPRGMFSS
jgi:transcriptional regulator with XRE-family HTH domain